MDILCLEHLRKSFGDKAVIHDLSLAVPKGSVYGFLGPNGAGKTTTMKMILGLLKADAGTITVCGEPVRFGETKTNRHIGYLPDVPEFYGYMRAKEYLRLCGEIAGMSVQQISQKSSELLSLVGLSGNNQKIAGYSRGMKQRLGIAQALLNDPKLLICDEPTSALDPVGRKEILEILHRAREKTTVLFSTHILSDAERICDHVAVLNEGRVTLNGTLDELRKQHGQGRLLVEFSSQDDLDRCRQLPELTQSFIGAQIEGYTAILCVPDLPAAETALLSVLVRESILPNRLENQEPTLESLFMEAIR
ncbi:MAG: ABC transporter ATP-binding protein [Eubacteriales bacterium]|nr:ABC transporter ATP-binding protein [Eubacteriales bacterium]